MKTFLTLVHLLCQVAVTFGQTYSNGDLRLVGGSNVAEGRVEIYYVGYWGTVCDDSWDTSDAQVVCRQLGFPTAGAEAYNWAHFGAGSGTIVLDEVACSGTESFLYLCSHNGWGNNDCSHYEDASVVCHMGAFTNVSLVDGGEPWKGRLMVERDGLWGTVCDTDWITENTRVVCNQLGFDHTGAQVESYGEGTGYIFMTSVACGASDTQLWDCSYSESTSTCAHAQDVGINCGAPPTTTTPAPTTTPPAPTPEMEETEEESTSYALYIGIAVGVILVVVIVIVVVCVVTRGKGKQSQTKVFVDPNFRPGGMHKHTHA